MTASHRALAGVVLGLVVAASAARAQVEEPAQRPQREEAFRLVDAYVVSHLQEGLGLSDEQFAKVVPLVTRLQRERRDYLIGRVRLMREMRRLLRQGGGVEAQVLERLAESKKLEAEGPERIRRDLEALDAALSPLQQAKYRVLEGEVERRMRELANRVRGARPGPRQRDNAPPRE